MDSTRVTVTVYPRTDLVGFGNAATLTTTVDVFFPAIAQLVGVWTPKSASLSVQRAVFVYDVSWVHDVIPLTDPVASTFIRLRPIAPIVHARRRRRR